MSNRKYTILGPVKSGNRSPPSPPPPPNHAARTNGGSSPRKSTDTGTPVRVNTRIMKAREERATDDSLLGRRMSEMMREDGSLTLGLAPVQEFNYFLVVDLQATCEIHSKPQLDPREIIEITVAKVDGKTFTVDAIFHQYVCPKVYKRLTKFCTQLTGISQGMVDGQPTLEPTLKKLHSWLHDQNLFRPGVSFATVTHSEWALKVLLPKNAGATAKYGLPDYFRKWIDITKIFKFRTGIDPGDELDPLNAMLKVFDLKVEGPRHSGMYVCHNIVQIMKALATRKQTVLYVNAP